MSSTNYQIYMLRIWQEPEKPSVVRLSMEDTREGNRMGFANWEEFLNYLKQQFGHEVVNAEED